MAGRAREIREWFYCNQEIRREAGTKVPQNLLELLFSLAEGLVVAPPSAISPSL